MGDLSATKEATYSIEGLYEEIDFSTRISRLDFENLLEGEDQFWSLVTSPIVEVLKKTGLTLSEVDSVEVVGGAWRTPKVLWTLQQYFKESNLKLGQHLNGEEAMVLGASLIAANTTRDVRPSKRVFFSDTFSDHRYDLEITAADTGVPLKRSIVLAEPGHRLGLKKKVVMNDSVKDFIITLKENGNVLTTWSVSGVEEAINSEKYSGFVHPRKLKEAQAKSLATADSNGSAGASSADSSDAVEGEEGGETAAADTPPVAPTEEEDSLE